MSITQTAKTRARDERGEGTIGVVVGAAIGLVVLAALLAFVVQSQSTASATTANAREQAHIVEASNRVRTWINNATSVVLVEPHRLVTEEVTGTGATYRRETVIDEAGDLLTAITPFQSNAVPVNDPNAEFVPDQVLAKNVGYDISGFAGTDALGAPSYGTDTVLVEITVAGVPTAARVG